MSKPSPETATRNALFQLAERVRGLEKSTALMTVSSELKRLGYAVNLDPTNDPEGPVVGAFVAAAQNLHMPKTPHTTILRSLGVYPPSEIGTPTSPAPDARGTIVSGKSEDDTADAFLVRWQAGRREAFARMAMIDL